MKWTNQNLYLGHEFKGDQIFNFTNFKMTSQIYAGNIGPHLKFHNRNCD